VSAAHAVRVKIRRISGLGAADAAPQPEICLSHRRIHSASTIAAASASGSTAVHEAVGTSITTCRHALTDFFASWLVTWILRGFALSATGIVSRSTPPR